MKTLISAGILSMALTGMAFASECIDFTDCSEMLTGTVIDDFKDGKKQVDQWSTGAYWYAYTTMGASIANKVVAVQTWTEWDVVQSAGYAALTGIIVGFEAGASAGIAIGGDALGAALAKCTGGISYKYKGAPHKVRVSMKSITPGQGYDHITAAQLASSDWKTVTVKKADLKQPDWVATKSPNDVKDLDLSDVNGLAWVVDDATVANGELDLDDIMCLSDGSTPSTNPNTPTAGGVLIDDLEDGDNIAGEMEAYWFVYAYKATLANNVYDKEKGHIGTDGTNTYATLNGINLGNSGEDDYSGVGVGISFEKVGVLSCAGGITYDYKGSAHKLRATMSSLTRDCGYDHESAVLPAVTDWTTVTVSSFSQESWICTSTDASVKANCKTFSWADVNMIVWVVDKNVNGRTSDLAIDNIRCVGTLSEAPTKPNGGSLWSMNAKNYQVQTPEAVACVPPAADDYSYCPQHTAGWWFAYVGNTKDGQKMGFEPIDYNADGTYKLITTYDDDLSEIIPNGNLQEGVGLVVTMSAAGGSASTPAFAGIGWNWRMDEGPISIADKEGFCFAYSWDGSQPLQVELGMPYDVEKATQYDTWFATLAPQSGAVADLPWAKFKQEAYDPGRKDLEFAKSNNVSVRIRIKNPDAAEVKGTLTINEVGWVGECKSGSAGTVPGTSDRTSAIVLLDSKAKSQTVAPGEEIKDVCFSYDGEMELGAGSKLPAGVEVVETAAVTCLKGTVKKTAKEGKYSYIVVVGEEELKISITVASPEKGDEGSEDDDDDFDDEECEEDEDCDDEDAIVTAGAGRAVVMLHGRDLMIAGMKSPRVEVFDMQGHPVKVAAHARGQVSLKSLRAGAYIVRARSGSMNLVKRIVVK